MFLVYIWYTLIIFNLLPTGLLPVSHTLSPNLLAHLQKVCLFISYQFSFILLINLLIVKFSLIKETIWYTIFCVWLISVNTGLTFHLFSCKWHDFIVLYDWIMFHWWICIFFMHSSSDGQAFLDRNVSELYFEKHWFRIWADCRNTVRSLTDKIGKHAQSTKGQQYEYTLKWSLFPPY